MNNQYKALITSNLYFHHLLIMNILLMKKEKDIFLFASIIYLTSNSMKT
ncbi:hypothetical protein HMPREF9135_2380 [Segatella baroniae F0067]|uniref:Uncharacterized protein n=1 Tax=Segatella baroniae F0067 TaxID=1115809 RepID=U2P4R7_9BACT|nr:hypothetical protein HMPREF9135_2380 [Segatella baroniae F0067]